MSRPTTAADLPGGPEFLARLQRVKRPVSGLVLLSEMRAIGKGHDRARDILAALMNRGDICSMGPDSGCPAHLRGYLVGEMYEVSP